MFEADFGDGSLCIAQLVEDAFFALLHHPFIGRFVEDSLENTAEGGDAIAAQLCEVFYRLYLLVCFNIKYSKLLVYLDKLCTMGESS